MDSPSTSSITPLSPRDHKVQYINKTNFCATKQSSIFSQPDTADEFFLIPDQYIDSTDIYNVINDKSVSFQYLCINIRSVVSNTNFSKLEAFLFSLNCRPDIIAVIETWIQPLSTEPLKIWKSTISSLIIGQCTKEEALECMLKTIYHFRFVMS